MLLAPGFLGWLAILHTGGPVESEPISLLGPIAFDPMWALVAGAGMALAYGATGLSKPRLVDCLPQFYSFSYSPAARSAIQSSTENSASRWWFADSSEAVTSLAFGGQWKCFSGASGFGCQSHRHCQRPFSCVST